LNLHFETDKPISAYADGGYQAKVIGDPERKDVFAESRSERF